jgi:predicted enzyme related to lactoylglutathione lyase
MPPPGAAIVDVGLNGQQEDALSAPRPVIRVTDLDADLDAVTNSGGVTARPIFVLPGRRRFHFIDP